MQKIREGTANISVSDGVFYNPKMSKLRDISVLFLKALGHKGARLLDCTSATGVRGIRYALEAGIRNVTLLDISKEATKVAKLNARRNNLKLSVVNGSVQEFACMCREAFDVIDLDPFGTPVPYVHDLLKVSKDGTALMITATDTATLCGAEERACLKLYGAKPIHNDLCHEVGIRILLNYIARAASQFNFGIEPALSISDMHYMRVFLFLRRGALEAAEAIKTIGFGSCCPRCSNFSFFKGIVPKVETKCSNCGGNMLVFGPVWLGGLHKQKMIARMLRLEGSHSPDAIRLLERVHEELDMPLFYPLSKITRYLKTSSVPLDKVIGVLGRKYKTSRTHFNANSIKTGAGINEVIEAIKRVNKTTA